MATDARIPAPTTADRLKGPAYVRFMWERYLQIEASYARSLKRRTIEISVEGAQELAEVLTIIRRDNGE